MLAEAARQRHLASAAAGAGSGAGGGGAAANGGGAKAAAAEGLAVDVTIKSGHEVAALLKERSLLQARFLWQHAAAPPALAQRPLP